MTERGFKSTQALAFVLTVLTVMPMCSDVLAAGGKQSAEAPTVILLKGTSDGISPSAVSVKQGDTIVWYNSGKGDVKIIFTTRIGIACTAPVNFYADLLGNYESSTIPKGGTASICLIDKGVYEYEARRLSSEGEGPAVEYVVKGKIIVDEKNIL